MWSPAWLAFALPARRVMARSSRVLSHHTPRGWNPNPPLKFAAACSFSECAVTNVASTSSTTVSPRSAPAAADAGNPSGSNSQTRRRARARALAIRFNAAGVTSSNVRHTVAGDATGPHTGWWRRVSMSPIASPPAARTVATSTRTWPRSCKGLKLRRASAVDNPPVSPTLSASSRSAADPANATTPVPSAVTDNPAAHALRFT